MIKELLDPLSDTTKELICSNSTKRVLDNITINVVSGSNRLLKLNGYKHTKEDIVKLHLLRSEMRNHWAIVLGLNGETDADLQETYVFVREMKPASIYIVGDKKHAWYDKFEQLSEYLINFHKESDNMLRLTHSKPRQTDISFTQYELWKDCDNHCGFCYNRNAKNCVNKIEQMNKVKKAIQEPKKLDYNILGFIGGELFSPVVINKDEQDCFIDLMRVVSDRIKCGDLIKVYVTSNLIYKDNTVLKRFLNLINNEGTIDKFCICTSWDIEHRFKTEERRKYWEDNMDMIHREFPLVQTHVETIITQALINAVLSGAFSIRAFEERFNTNIDWMAPNAGYAFPSKEAFNRDVPNFFPTRDSFMKFLNKTVIQDKTINIHKLFSRELQCDKIYFQPNNYHDVYVIENRVTSVTPFPCDQPRLVGYIDSDVFMKYDVLMFKEALGL